MDDLCRSVWRQAGISWKVYQQEDNYGCNMLENFKQFQRRPKNSALYKRGMLRGQEGQFEYDAINDKLPTVSWIIPTAFQSEHPDYMPADGAAFVASKIDAIAANPDVWAKTLFILNYDENDGIFDHVAPPNPPAGTPHEFVDGLPIGGGFRVPCIADFAVDHRRMGVQRYVRPHVVSSVSGKADGGARAEYQRLATEDVWRHDDRSAVWRWEKRTADFAGYQRAVAAGGI